MARVWAELTEEELLLLWQIWALTNNTIFYRDNSWIVQSVALWANGTYFKSTWITWVPTFWAIAWGWETNTASNVWTAWVWVFKQKTWVDLEFKKINAWSTAITITDDVANNEVDIDFASWVATLDNITQITNRSHTLLTDIWTNTHTQIDTHIANVTTNPHNVTKTNVWLWNVDNTSDSTKNAATVTLSNKRITERVNTIASSATPTPAWDTTDMFTVTALAVWATFAAPTWTPTDWQVLLIRIKDNWTARSLAWNAIYRASSDLALPTTTVLSKTLYLQFVYNSADSKFDLLGLLNNF